MININLKISDIPLLSRSISETILEPPNLENNLNNPEDDDYAIETRLER